MEAARSIPQKRTVDVAVHERWEEIANVDHAEILEAVQLPVPQLPVNMQAPYQLIDEVQRREDFVRPNVAAECGLLRGSQRSLFAPRVGRVSSS